MARGWPRLVVVCFILLLSEDRKARQGKRWYMPGHGTEDDNDDGDNSNAKDKEEEKRNEGLKEGCRRSGMGD